MAILYDLKEQEKVYQTWAKYYDKVYYKLLEASQRKVAEAASMAGPRILEIGVGTGLVLRYYAANTEVIGADLSVPMLRRAQEKVRDLGLAQVRGLVAMDACKLGFPDACFDAISVPFVITLVPNPEGALDEIARVLKPGGTIAIVSRFGAEAGPQAAFESMIAPLMKKVGWSSSFKVSRVTDWANKRGDVELVDVQPGLYFKLVRLRKKA
jgi:phosphatidylethanolamine/phosphatidyl-N-methylethanolamine N-methyltransferase